MVLGNVNTILQKWREPVFHGLDMPRASAVQLWGCRPWCCGVCGHPNSKVQTEWPMSTTSKSSTKSCWTESSSILEELCDQRVCLFLDFKDGQHNSRSMSEASAFLVCPEQETPSFLTLLWPSQLHTFLFRFEDKLGLWSCQKCWWSCLV